MDMITPRPEWLTESVSVDTIIRSLGISGKYIGLTYLTYAVEQVLQDADKLQYVTKNLYPEIAKHFQCQEGHVERSIRTVAGIAWDRNADLLCEMAGFNLQRRPTCTELIDYIVNYIRKNHFFIR